MGGKRGSARDDFFEALERLQNGTPSNPELQARAAKGKLSINFSTVAQEAGRSRTLIGLDEEKQVDDAYEEVRQAIRDAMSTEGANTEEHLRAQIRDLEDLLDSQQHQMLNEVRARERAERDRDTWRKAYSELVAGRSNVHLIGGLGQASEEDGD